MKKFDQDGNLSKMYCNRCGRQLSVHSGMLKEFAFEGETHFGYFSKKDGESHSFDLCETCYDAMVGQFVIPVDRKQEFEWQRI